jgi:hypothetical protein
MFERSKAIEFEEYCSYMEYVMLYDHPTLRMLAFTVYDFNGNNFLCQLDIVSFIKTWDNFELLQDVFIDDLMLLISTLK